MIDDKKNLSFVVGRVSANFLVFLLILLTPWWVYLVVMLFLIFYFNPYYEVVIPALFIDALYGSPAILGFPLFFTSCSLILLATSQILSKRLYR